MKMVYTKDGYKAYNHKAGGYNFRVFVTPKGHASVQVPLGNTPKEVSMFDTLVYYNKDVYNGRTKIDAIHKVVKFIKSYKKEHGIK